MKKPRFFTGDEEARSFARPEEIDLDSLVPFDTIKISSGTYRALCQIGNMIEYITKIPFEFYVEGFSIKGDPIIRDFCLPVQEDTSIAHFNPTQTMVLQCRDYMKSLRQSTGQQYITTASMHGHGRFLVSDGMKFSDIDVNNHMVNFLRTQSLTTRQILPMTSDLSLMLNSMDVDKTDDGSILLTDEFAYHPEILIAGLSEEQQKVALARLGLNPDDLHGRSTSDVIASHLKVAAESGSIPPISARQRIIMSYNYFMVFDNEEGHYSEIAIMLEDTVTHKIRMHRKVASLEPVEVEGDKRYSLKDIERMVTSAFGRFLEKEKATVVSVQGLEDRMSSYNQFIWDKYGLTPDVRVEKVPSGEITEKELITLFFHSAEKYIDLAKYEDHKYSGFLSDVLKMYAHEFDNLCNPLTCAVNAVANYGFSKQDHGFAFVNTDLGLVKGKIVEHIYKGFLLSPDKSLEINFMLDFAYSPDVTGQNNVIERYIPLFDKHSRHNRCDHE